MNEIILINIVLGTSIGLVLALTGAGGAILAIPLLMQTLHLDLNQAAPIALIAILASASIGAIQGLRQGIVRYKAALLIAGFGILLSPLGAYLAHILPQHSLAIVFALVLLYIAYRTWQTAAVNDDTLNELPPPACAINPATSKLFWTANCTKRLILTGIMTGFLSGLLGIGGGFVIVPSLKKVSNFDHATTIATTLAIIALISFGSLISHAQHTSIDWQIAAPFVISTTLSMLVLGQLRHHIPRILSQRLFAVLCVLAAFALLFKY